MKLSLVIIVLVSSILHTSKTTYNLHIAMIYLSVLMLVFHLHVGINVKAFCLIITSGLIKQLYATI